jgi:hypothetical protein
MKRVDFHHQKWEFNQQNKVDEKPQNMGNELGVNHRIILSAKSGNVAIGSIGNPNHKSNIVC